MKNEMYAKAMKDFDLHSDPFVHEADPANPLTPEQKVVLKEYFLGRGWHEKAASTIVHANIQTIMDRVYQQTHQQLKDIVGPRVS